MIIPPQFAIIDSSCMPLERPHFLY